MRSVTNMLCLVFLLTVIASPLLGQTTRPAATQPQSAQSRPASSPSGNFRARTTLGPVLSIPEIEINGRNARSYYVYGPVWDGVNGGLWIVLQDHRDRNNPAVALLVDLDTGKEERRLDVPTSHLVTHDGVGLWFEVPARSADGKQIGTLLQRVRTAPGLTHGQQEHGMEMPEDVATSIPVEDMRVVSSAPHVSVARFWRLTDTLMKTQTRYLSEWFMDVHTCVQYAEQNLPYGSVTSGGGYLWVFADSLKRVALADLRALLKSPSSSMVKAAPWSEGRIEGPVPHMPPRAAYYVGDAVLAWDGQRLWSCNTKEVVDKSELRPSGLPGGVEDGILHLVSIDVGLTRKPDTTARYNKALAFEKKNGTLKAIPLFEELIASDPAAVEIRNHLGWALGTRPKEPYHDLQRAKMLVESALEWQPWDPEKWDTLAEIYWRLGDAKLAEHLEAKAINLNPAKTFYWKQLDKFRTQPGSDDAPEPAY